MALTGDHSVELSRAQNVRGKCKHRGRGNVSRLVCFHARAAFPLHARDGSQQFSLTSRRPGRELPRTNVPAFSASPKPRINLEVRAGRGPLRFPAGARSPAERTMTPHMTPLALPFPAWPANSDPSTPPSLVTQGDRGTLFAVCYRALAKCGNERPNFAKIRWSNNHRSAL
jgi:hypothetical protein